MRQNKNALYFKVVSPIKFCKSFGSCSLGFELLRSASYSALEKRDNSRDPKMSSRTFKFPAKAKTALYLITGTGTATGLAFNVSNPNSLSLSHDSFFGSSNLPEKIRTVFHGVLRSSRAISTVRPHSFSLAFILQYICFLLHTIGYVVIVIVLFFLLGSCDADCLHCCRLQVFFTWASGGLWRVPLQIEWGFPLSLSLVRSIALCFCLIYVCYWEMVGIDYRLIAIAKWEFVTAGAQACEYAMRDFICLKLLCQQ